MAFCAPPVHNSLYHPFVRPFTSPITPLSRTCSHLITCLIQLLLQDSLQLLCGYLASPLTILGNTPQTISKCQQNHYGQTKQPTKCWPLWTTHFTSFTSWSVEFTYKGVCCFIIKILLWPFGFTNPAKFWTEVEVGTWASWLSAIWLAVFIYKLQELIQ